VSVAVDKPVRRVRDVGDAAYELMGRLFPLCRSLTGAGLRETFAVLQEHLPLTITEIPSGTRVFDWTIPDEWTIRDAYSPEPMVRG
jgi:aminopeptidase-like protein